MPRPVDPIEIDEREPPIAHDLEVVAGDRSAPPGLLHPPAIADLDGLAPAVPADRLDRTRPPRAPRRSAGARAGGGSRCHSPFARGDRTPRPAQLGEGRLRIGDVHPPDPVLPERQGQPRELPLEPGAPGGLWREQRELLPGSRGGAVQPQREPGDRGRWRGPLEAGEQQALDRLGVGGGLREALLDVQLARRAGQGEGQVEVQVEASPARRPGRAPRAGRSGPRPAGGGRSGVAPGPRWRVRSGAPGARCSGARRGRNGSSSWPRARAWIRAPSSPNRATRADRARSATGPIRRNPNRVSRARTSGSAVRRPDGCGARNSASPPGGTRSGDAGPGQDGGHGRAEPGAGDPGPDLARGRARRLRPPSPVSPRTRPSASTSRATRTGSGPHSASRPSTWTSNSPNAASSRVGAAGDPGAECRERLEGGLDGRPVRVGIRVDEGRLRDEPMGAPERHPPPDAQRPGFRARVDDRARIPRPAAQDERAGAGRARRLAPGRARAGGGVGGGGAVASWSVRSWVAGAGSGASSMRRSSRPRQASRSPPSA